jgi:heat shock protein HtpX
MQYVGIHTQQARNNFRSVVLLCLFPCLVVLLIFLFSVLLAYTTNNGLETADTWQNALFFVRQITPYIIGGIAVWFLIAYFANTSIIRSATGARPLERKENKRVYNLVENLCMSQGMQMPQINVIEDDSLNAFASGINNRTYTVSLSRGIINKLNDDELESVIAHELSHIRNRDVRLLIVSIVFVGIFAMLTEIALRSLRYAPRRSGNNKNGGGAIAIILIALVVAAIGYFFSTLMRFAISRNREYLADAGSAEMTHKPQALASALQKISGDPDIEAVTRDDIAQLFIEHPHKQKKAFAGITGLFATHPPIEKRIQILEQF